MAVCLTMTGAAAASRGPSADEARAIKAAALRSCHKQETGGGKCTWRGGVRVSTVSARYAWANVTGPSYDNSGVLKRDSSRSARWRMLRVVGGGIQPCEYWYAVVPRRVVRDLKIRGYSPGSGNYDDHPC